MYSFKSPWSASFNWLLLPNSKGCAVVSHCGPGIVTGFPASESALAVSSPRGLFTFSSYPKLLVVINFLVFSS